MLSTNDLFASRFLGAQRTPALPTCLSPSDDKSPPLISPTPHHSSGDIFAKTADYAAAIQLMQLQVLCQPNFLNAFVAQLAQFEALNNLYKEQSSKEVVFDVVRERKRASSRNSDDSSSYMKRSKTLKRLTADKDTSSPVSGMFIKVHSSNSIISPE
ncbi:unnamed protein product [Anisakis simplex]|uniref:TPR_REGION domain-containing protein n=1 Tax=Anisakis simplex TaxID=6269 RepID=A0A0M3J4N6_ANISI|nr:unnamed protein product [Anisakis simplex]